MFVRSIWVRTEIMENNDRNVKYTISCQDWQNIWIMLPWSRSHNFQGRVILSYWETTWISIRGPTQQKLQDPKNAVSFSRRFGKKIQEDQLVEKEKEMGTLGRCHHIILKFKIL